MINRFAFASLALVAPRAFAQPATTFSSGTPAVVESVQPETSKLAERIYRKGNLRLSINCAATWATPDTGLALTVDGRPLDAQRLNGRWSFYVDSDGDDGDGDDPDVDGGEVWAPTDVGYLVAPGHHHVEIAAPGCEPTTFDMDAYADHTQHAIGRLAVADSSLMGPVGAPNGWGTMIGGWFGAAPARSTTNSLFNQTAVFDGGHDATGLALSFSIERRHLVLAIDQVFATVAASGTVSGQALGSNQPVTEVFTGSSYLSTTQLRAGGKLPLRVVALEGGGGVGVQWWLDNSETLVGSQATGLFAPQGMDATLYLPLWASATLKPTCNWGVQVIGQYDVHPTSIGTDGFEIMGGILYQPSASCSEPAGVHVSPT